MWHLSSYAHTLCRLYRFRDGKMEQAYHAAILKKEIYVAQACYVLGLFWFCDNSVSYLRGSGLVSDFWVNLAGAVGSLLCLINGWTTPFVRRHPVHVHFVYNVFLLAIIFSLASIQPNRWHIRTWGQLVPDGHRIYLEAGDGTRTDIEPVIRTTLLSIFGRLEYALLHSYVFNFGVLFCLHGLRSWTFAWLAVCAASMIYAACSTGSQDFLNTIDFLVQQSFSAVWCLAVALLFEREQRQKYLAEVLLERQMHASTTADSILNHMLKNTLSDGVAHIELFLAGSASRAALHDGVSCLRRGMRACRERQVYLQLVAGDYVPVLNTVNLTEFGKQLVAGRAATSTFPDTTVLLDRTLMSLILDNALSNAFKHGCRHNPDVRFSIDLTTLGLETVVQLEFLVSNAADPRQPPITPQTFARIVEKSGPTAGLRRTAVLSDGIGLAHCMLAAEVAECSISLEQTDNRVEFRATLTVARTSPEPLPEEAGPALPNRDGDCGNSSSLSLMAFDSRSLPPGLRLFILDDSAASRRILEHQIRSHCPSATITTFGDTEADINLCAARAAEEADVVIVDQHLEYSASHLGTSVLRRMKLMGFRGLMCIRSGDDSEDDRAYYAECGAHCFLGKDLPAQRVINSIIVAYHNHNR